MDTELKYPVKSLHKALSIFEMLIHEGRDLSLTEISQGLRLEKGTVHRILATMRARKFVEQDPASKKYGLGTTSFQLGFRLNKDEILRKMMLPTLRWLCGKTGNSKEDKGRPVFFCE